MSHSKRVLFSLLVACLVSVASLHGGRAAEMAAGVSAVAESRSIRDEMDDFDRRLYDRVKKANKQNIQIRGIAIIGFVLVLTGLAVSVFYLVRKLGNAGNRTAEAPLPRHERPSRPPRAGRENRLETWLGRAFLVLGVSVVAFLVLDAFVGPRLSTRSELEAIAGVGNIRAPKPYVMFAGKEGQPDPANDINRRGYRGRLAEMPKPAGEFRIFVLGGSTVWNGKPPITELLERRFAAAGYANVKVYNYGVVSSVSGMALARLVHEIGDLAPDFIVFYNGGNDMLHAFGPDGRIGYPYNFLVWESNPLLESDVDEYPAMALFLYGSPTLRHLFKPWFDERFRRNAYRNGVEPATAHDPAWYKAVAGNYLANVRKAAQFSKSLNARFAVFFQPTLFSKGSLSADEAGITTERGMGKHIAGLRGAIQGGLRELIGTTPGVNVFDISDIFSGESETIFTDTIHVTQPAKEKIGAELFHSLRPLVPKN